MENIRVACRLIFAIQDAVEAGLTIRDLQDAFDKLAEREALLNKPITELGLSTRLKAACQNQKVVTIRDAVRKYECEWRKIKNIGKKSVKELRELLAREGFSMGEDV